VKFEVCGKVIVAVDESEIPALERIEERGIANGVACERIGAERLRELESHAAGIAALHVPGTGIVDYRGACERLAHRIREAGGTILLNAHVTAMHPRSDSVVVRSTASEVEAKRVVNCAGLYSDRVTALSGPRPAEHIIPFRGEYFELKPHAQHLCRNLIYPVPNPAFPFLGVHFTRLATGGVECGPNAVLAFAREGYHNTDVDVRDLIETLAFRGFRRLMSRHWRTGLGELWRSFSKAAFVRALQRLVPAIRAEDLIPAPAGVRAMAIAPDGAMVDDFLIETHERVVNVLNAPSPAATAALNIGKMIVARLH
jgi:L-2-hydroxyglutarate oxidase